MEEKSWIIMIWKYHNDAFILQTRSSTSYSRHFGRFYIWNICSSKKQLRTTKNKIYFNCRRKKQLSDFSLYRSEIPPWQEDWIALLVLGKILVHIVVVVLAVAGALRELSHVVVHLLARQLGVRSWKNNEETIWKLEISINQHKKNTR